MSDLASNLDGALLAGLTGSVVQTVGMTAAVADFPAPVGAVVSIQRQSGDKIEAEVVGFRDSQTLVMPLGNFNGVRRGGKVQLVRTTRTLRVGQGLMGRVVDARGRCIDGRPQPMLRDRLPLFGELISATERPRIDTAISTGIKAIDGMLTCGQGQRLGIFAGSGVGKSVLLGMMARFTDADVIVIGLIGERGREVNEFIQRELGSEGQKRSVVVVATSNESALMRVQAAYTATTVAEYFRDTGKNVLLVMDSLTRFAHAQREIGLSAGEPPTTRGYPPSVFSLMPKIIERAGRAGAGTITAFYSILVEGDDENEPIADSARGLLDGHIWLSRKIAERGHYPAIDVLSSVSRLVSDISQPQQEQAIHTLRRLMAVHAEHEDLLSIGAYRKGANHELDVAIEMKQQFDAALTQQRSEQVSLAEVRQTIMKLAQSSLQLTQGNGVAAQQAEDSTN